jgi:hypothetical protein
VILRFRFFPFPCPVIREIRFCSRHGIWRFFRVEDAGIVEISPEGTPLKNPFQEVARTHQSDVSRENGVCPGEWMTRSFLISLSGVPWIHTPGSPLSGLLFPVPEAFLTVIREKPALLFWESHGSQPVRLSGVILQLEMTANSTYCEANLRSDRSGVAEGRRGGKKGGFDMGRANSLLSGHSQIHTPCPPLSGLLFPVPEAFLTVIREKPALLFWESHGYKPVRLSGAILQLEMTANSTYCEANLRSDRSGVAEGRRGGKKGGFGDKDLK